MQEFNHDIEKNKENIIEKPTIKEGVDFVFEQKPEMTQIGTKEKYLLYLDTIFPDSKDKNIWYHGTNSNPNEIIKFKPSSNGTVGPGVYFESKHGKYYTETFGANPMAAIVNVEKVFDFKKDGQPILDELREKYKSMGGLGEKTMIAFQNTIRPLGYDSIIYSLSLSEYLVIFEPDNIHVLGSERDIEEFKEFVMR